MNPISVTTLSFLVTLCSLTPYITNAFMMAPFLPSTTTILSSRLWAEGSMATQVTGEQLELLMQEWDQPLVVDAYATWCGPCLLMAPEFEAAAKELEGQVRFVKLDTDREETMAARLNIMGLPTLLFLDKFQATEDETATAATASAVLKGRMEGALRKDAIVQLCKYYFFDGPIPDGFGR